MKMPATLGALVALGALTALPACSMFGGDHGTTTTGQYNEHSYTAPAGYASTANSQAATNQDVPTSPALVRKVQAQLKQNGDYNSRVDGVWGPMTENGVRKWQQAHNLQASGAIDMATLQSMNISADQNQQANGTDTGSQANTNNSQANNGQSGSTQPTTDQSSQANANPPANYNTAGNHQTGSSYSSNNGNPPATTPSPTNSGTGNGTTANGTNGNTNATQH